MLKTFNTLALPVIIIITLGTFGYHWLEGWTLFDSFYMTIITLTTVGFEETHPLSSGGRMFTLFILVTGLGNMAYLISHFSQGVLQNMFKETMNRKKMDKKLNTLENHYIICGFGRVGSAVAKNLIEASIPVVVIDQGHDPDVILQELDCVVVIGDASHEENLIKAGIERAKGLVSAVHSEAENVFITLTARELNPKLYILARYEENSTQKKLLHAGANRVINPYRIGSERISQMILRPTVSNILEKATERGEFELNIEEFHVPKNSFLDQKTLIESQIRDHFNLIIIAIDHGDGDITFNPHPNQKLTFNDRLVVIGNQEGITSLKNKLGD